MADSDYSEENGLLLDNGGKKGYIWTKRNSFWCLLELPCSVIIVNGKLQQPSSGSTANGLEPSEMKFWIIPPEKET